MAEISDRNGMKKIIKFTIKGNQEDSTGNPIPYHRTTQGAKWNKASQRYSAWKSYVVAHYLDALGLVEKIDRADFGDAHDLIQKKPIADRGRKMHMSIMIFFRDLAHADSDNVFKGIADSLFMNDKYLSGDFDFVYSPIKQGLVKVTIAFS